jgi:hypothetical protein
LLRTKAAAAAFSFCQGVATNATGRIARMLRFLVVGAAGVGAFALPGETVKVVG